MNKEQAFEFLAQLVDKINAQYNRCTAKPYFYVVRTQKWRLTKDGYGHGETRRGWVDHSGDPDVYYSKEDFIKSYIERHDYELTAPEPLDAYELGDPQCVATYNLEYAEYTELLQKLQNDAEEAFEDLEEFEEEEYYDEDNVFFTQEAYEEHVRLNGHNLGRRGEYHSYVKHAFRNPEMQKLFEAIAAVTGKEWK